MQLKGIVMAYPRMIAVDGPAGSGKSTICDLLAERYGYAFVDTGAFYRAITVLVVQGNIDPADLPTVQGIVDTLKLRIVPQGGGVYQVIANEQDVTDQLRSKAVDETVSAIAKIPFVRQAMQPLQREVALNSEKIILAGRDIGTVVLPDADLKLYIDASVEERAKRRYEQYIQSGKETSLETELQALKDRDKTDSERSHSPLKQADDAIYILTDGLNIEDVMAKIEPHIKPE